MHIRQLLQRKGSLVVTIAADLSVLEASRELGRYGVGALVVTGDDDACAGILSERDIARAVARHGAAALDLAVDSIMTTEVTTCAPGDTTDALAEVMTSRRIRHLPVVEDGRLVGIVSIGDIVKHRLDDLQAETRALHDYLYAGL